MIDTGDRGQKYFNIALVLQDMCFTLFTCPANTCTCLKSVCNKEHKGVICNMTLGSSSQSSRPVGQVLWEELLVLSRFHL